MYVGFTIREINLPVPGIYAPAGGLCLFLVQHEGTGIL